MTAVVRCLSCGGEAWGFPWAELAKEGWERHHARGEPVHLCGGCSQAYEEARKLEKIPTREKT